MQLFALCLHAKGLIMQFLNRARGYIIVMGLSLVFSNSIIIAGQFTEPIMFDLGESHTIPVDFLGVNSSQANPAESISMMDMFQRLNAGHIRYPGGGIANYWDWEAGRIYRHLDENKLLWWMHGMMENEQTFTLNDLAEIYHTSGSSVVFVLNMVTDDLDHQVAMLRIAENLGIPVERVELGNELYLEVEPYSVERYPTAADYAIASNQWAARLKEEFPGVQIAVVGSGRPSAPQGARMGSWNRSIIPLLSNNIDAIAEHIYIDSGVGPRVNYNGTSWGTSEEQQEQWSMYNTPQGVVTFLSRSFLAWNNFHRFSTVDDTREIWLTEFNLFDWNGPVRGTWGGGLLVAGFVHNFLVDDLVTLATYHSLGGGPLFPAFFPSENLWADANIPHPRPTLHELTATGTVISILNRGMKDMTTATELVFSPTLTETVITTTYPTLWGWQFSNETEQRYLLANTSIEPVNIDLSTIDMPGLQMQQFSAPATEFITNRDVITHTVQKVTELLELPPYSLTLILKEIE